MNYFGPKWNAPVTDEAEQVETPVDTPCQMCQEEIQDGDSGVRHRHWGQEGSYSYSHKECMLRSVLGSPSHLDGDCTPEGHEKDDEMTYREQALEVWRRVQLEGIHV